tara:strand:- start:602 stop:919 length:318 start_codon:yes stop_codon:yes gene_type:complete
MIGYYLIDLKKKEEKFCVPYNLIVTRTNRGDLEIELDPSELKRGINIFIDNNRKPYTERTIEKIQIPDRSMERLRELCFSVKMREAILNAEALFLWVRSMYKKKN